MCFGIRDPEAIDFTFEDGLNLEFELKKAKVQETAANSKKVPKKTLGRPKVSLNRKIIERMKLEA